MPDRMIFVTQDDLIGTNFVHPQMVKDLLGVAHISSESIDRIAESLLSEDGFLTEDRLGEIVAGVIDDEDTASSVASAIQNLRPEIIDQAISMIRTWRASSEANRGQFPDEALDSLARNLPQLIRDYPALARMRKAKRLRGVLGNELEKVEFICDARPVFDKDREKIEGLLATTTMKLLYERQNGSTEELEIVLTAERLDDLISKAEKAKQKLGVLENSFPNWLGNSNE